ncbi:hypothetical protein MOV08_15930 [Streptomyces yunnanensis]|uniref:NACHT domain-containing protein n=1 Tax=Streptomyces yunnanensis TaxID=156453 RepID=A0ABY8A7C3_9ACTN|nr:hypothetical protein [Streptomyces yunnanensis]WEB40624.1 hypothetical protein MOV08_15930 [Streptomyces yunnanensis]
MKFDLTTLGPREFENLSQALAVAELGSALTVFGAGPDGGREATFRGEVSFGENGPSWNGYGVIQAKYCETLSTPQRDATWLIKQIHSEMNAWATSPKRKPRPEYIVFATNVSLSAVPRAGGIDRVSKELDAQCKALGLKGWHVWHAESIHRLLEVHAGVRTSYAAWILPGDVLAELYSHLSVRRQATARAFQRYLARELLRDLHVNLDQAGSADDVQISLADVFIDLPMGHHGQHSPDQPMNTLETLILKCDRKASGSTFSHEKPNIRRYVLVGGPGQGKSTISQFLCQLYRAKMITEAVIGKTADVAKAVRLINSHAERENLSPKAHRWPVKIPLTQLADDLAHGRSKSILQFLAQRVTDAADFAISPADLREWLASFPWLLLLDGLDEVPLSSNRDQVMQAINDFLMEVEEASADIVIVATTRPQGYTEEFSPSFFRHFELKPLNKDRALHYAEKLAVARHGAASDRTDRLMRRLSQAADEAATARLMSSPLQVTIMAVLLDRIGKAPKDRYSLFRDYYRVIYERELEKEGPSTNLLQDYKADIDSIHADVGLLLQIRSERSGDTESRIGTAEFKKVVRQRLETEGHGGAGLDNLTDSVIRAATDRLVFLVPSRADEVGFEIRSLQEFWAADALMSSSDENIRERLGAISASSHWRNVLLFSIGKIFAERRHLRDAVGAVVAELNSFSAQPHSQNRRLLLGSRLAVDILADGMVKAPKHEAVLIDQAMKLLALPADPVLEQLANCLSETGVPVAHDCVDTWLLEKQKVTESLLTFLGARCEVGDTWASQRLHRIREMADVETRRKLLELGFEMNYTSLLELSARDLLDVPSSQISRLCNFGWRRRQSTRLSPVKNPDWFNEVVAIFDGARTEGPYVTSLATGFVQFGFASDGYAGDERWARADFTEVPKTHWIRKVQDFARDPSTGSLGAAVAACIESESSAWQSSYALPWPIGAVLQDLVDDQISIDRIADPQYVGDPERWRAIEDSWGPTISWEQATVGFHQSIRDDLPFFPIGCSAVRFADRRRRDTVSQRLLASTCEELARCPENTSRAFLAELVLAAITGFVSNRDGWTPSEVRHLRQMTEYSLYKSDRADLDWVHNIRSVDEDFLDWIDSIEREKPRRILAHGGSRVLVREWTKDFRRSGLGAILCKTRSLKLTKAAMNKIAKEWRRVAGHAEVDIHHRATVCLALSWCAPPADEADYNRRLETLREGVLEGVFAEDHVVELIGLFHNPLQQKLLLTLLDELKIQNSAILESAFERLVADQMSVPTKVEYSALESG